MTSDETQIQTSANWRMSHAKRVTRDNRKNPEYRVIAAIRKLRTDKLSRRRIMAKPCKNEQHIGSEKTYGHKIYWTAEHNDAKDRRSYVNTQHFRFIFVSFSAVFLIQPAFFLPECPRAPLLDLPLFLISFKVSYQAKSTYFIYLYIKVFFRINCK